MATKPIRNISDTARWAAVYRAQETERPDALFKDPFARRLAGEGGQAIAEGISRSARNEWAWVTRTLLFDRHIAAEIAEGADAIVNLAAGLDARPYRMALPAALKWIEVDLTDVLAYKEEMLADAKPACALERVALDLSNVEGRRALFERLGQLARRVLVITEGLLVYFSADEVASLARDLAAPASFRRWILDLCSPGLLRLLQRKLGPQLGEAGGPALKFGPPEGPGFFTPHGWSPISVQGLLKTAARLGRLSFFLRMMAMLPEPTGPQGSRPWGGVCLMGRS